MARKPRIITEIVQYLRNVAAYLEARPLTSREFRAETGRNADDIRALAKELDTRYDARSLNLEPTQRAKRKTKSASTKKAAKRAATR
jgi:chromosome segregation and condensation protein ScpB